MRHWLESTIGYWIGPLAIIVLLLCGAILLKLARLWSSIREPYRSILIFVIVLAAGFVWNYATPPEQKRKLQEDLCKPAPAFDVRRSDCAQRQPHSAHP
jgi:hypothetical protein